MSYNLTPDRITIIKKFTENKRCWYKCKLVQSLWIIVQRLLKKLKIELPEDPAIAFLGIDTDKI